MVDRVSHVPVRDRLIVASGIVFGFVYGVALALIDEGRVPSTETVIGAAVYGLLASGLALRPENVVERVIGAAAMCVAALWAPMVGTLLPYAAGVTDMSIQELGREVNDDVEWWWVFGQWAIVGLFAGAFLGLACGVVAHVGVLMARRLGLWKKGIG